MVSISKCFSIGLLFLLSANLWAADVFYSSEQQLHDQSPGQILSASKRALSEVLIRVSGNRELLRNKNIRMALGVSDRYVQQYSFAGYIKNDKGEQLQKYLFKFDMESVDSLLQRAGLPIWPIKRPPVLLWYLIEDSLGRRFLSPDEDSEVVEKIISIFKKRGLEIQFPLFDLEDASLVEMSDILRLDRFSIAKGGMRYDSVTILAGRLSQLSDANWVSDSLYILNGQSYSVPGRDGDLALLVESLADFASIKMSAEYALQISEESAAGITFYLGEINDFKNYAAALDYLEGIQAVKNANIEYISAGNAVFRIYFQGQMKQFQQALALDGKLRLLEALPDEFVSHEPIKLTYRWPSTTELSDE